MSGTCNEGRQGGTAFRPAQLRLVGTVLAAVGMPASALSYEDSGSGRPSGRGVRARCEPVVKSLTLAGFLRHALKLVAVVLPPRLVSCPEVVVVGL